MRGGGVWKSIAVKGRRCYRWRRGPRWWADRLDHLAGRSIQGWVLKRLLGQHIFYTLAGIRLTEKKYILEFGPWVTCMFWGVDVCVRISVCVQGWGLRCGVMMGCWDVGVDGGRFGWLASELRNLAWRWRRFLYSLAYFSHLPNWFKQA